MDIIEFIWNNWSIIVDSAATIVSACAAIAALTPPSKDDEVLRNLRKIVDVLALNWGHAKNRK